MIRDFSRFPEEDFNSELAQVDWGSILARAQGNIEIAFSKIYSKLNKLVNKHAPLEPKGYSNLLKIENALFAEGGYR